MKKIIIVFMIIAAGIAAYFFIHKPAGKTAKIQKESLVIKGSDTEVQMVSNLAEAYLEQDKNADISVTGGGSGVGIASLLNGEIDMANSSRKMKSEELKTAQDKGIQPQEFILAIDGLSIIINPENPITNFTLSDLSKIYQEKITNWKDLGGKDAKIVLYGRQSTSGTYTFFRDTVVKGDYSPRMLNMEGNQAIVDAVKSDANGIGYVGVGYITDKDGKPRTDIKITSVSKEPGSPALSPLDKDAVKKGTYPISRSIYQYLSGLPKKDSLQEKFLKFETSQQGREIVEKAGFYSINEDNLKQNQSLLDKIK